MNMAFAEMLRAWMRDNYKTPHALASEWGLRPETISGLLSGRLLPSGEGHISFFAVRLGIPRVRIARAINPVAKQSSVNERFAEMLRGMGL